MCGRMYMEPEEQSGELHAIIEIMRKNFTFDNSVVKLSGEIFPSNVIPVISMNDNSNIVVSPMKWGFKRFDGKGLIINARSETAQEKPTFKESVKNKRCIVPVSYYFEWETHENKKIKHALRPVGSRIVYIAGIYKIEKFSEEHTFSLLTRQAHESISFIHDRMPVIMKKDMLKDYLTSGASFDALINDSLGEMEYWAV